MRDLSQETWSADIGGDVDSRDITSVHVYNQNGDVVATAYGKTFKEAKTIADAIANLPDTFDPPDDDE